MTEPPRQDDPALDALLAQARRDVPPVPDDLFNRIMADAAATDAARRHRAAPPPSPSWIGLFRGILGGWPAAAGLAMAALAGVWIGAAQPVALVRAGLLPELAPGLADATGGEPAYELGDLMPAFDDLDGEG